HESLLLNIGLMFLQYLSPMIIFVSLTLFAIAFPRVGSLAHVLAVLLLLLFLFDLSDRVASLLVMLPMLLLGCLYWYGRPHPRRPASLLATGLPVLTLIACGVEPAARGAGRVDDAAIWGKAPT